MQSQQNNSVLVTGGRGFIGRAVVKLLQRSDIRVISLDRNPLTADNDREHEVQCDLSDAGQLHEVFARERIAGIIHLAAILPTTAQRNPFSATQVNVLGSLNLLEKAREFGVRRFVFGSSLSVYGTYSADRVVSESDKAAPEDLYGAAKLYVEKAGQAYHDSHGLNFVSLRIGRVVGPGANSISSAWRSEIFELLSASHPVRIFVPYQPTENILVVHLEDLGAMLLAVLRAPRTEYSVYNSPCQPVVVSDLKHAVENLNSNITVDLGDGLPSGNPRSLDFSRFQHEFAIEPLSIFDRLRKAAGR